MVEPTEEMKAVLVIVLSKSSSFRSLIITVIRVNQGNSMNAKMIFAKRETIRPFLMTFFSELIFKK